MKKTVYFCDLCGKDFNKYLICRTPDMIIVRFWIEGGKIKKKKKKKCHICMECIDNLRNVKGADHEK